MAKIEKIDEDSFMAIYGLKKKQLYKKLSEQLITIKSLREELSLLNNSGNQLICEYNRIKDENKRIISLLAKCQDDKAKIELENKTLTEQLAKYENYENGFEA